MSMSESERVTLADRVRIERKAQFGTKSAAYSAAGLNSATWDRIEAGQNVREDRLIQALKTLWPYSKGDWKEVLYPTSAHFSLGLVPWLRDGEELPARQLVDGLREMETYLADLGDRVSTLERLVASLVTDASTTPTADPAPEGSPRLHPVPEWAARTAARELGEPKGVPEGPGEEDYSQDPEDWGGER